MNLEAAIARVEATGLRLNNLFQLKSGVWQCNLRDDRTQTYAEFATGETPAQAVMAALEKAKKPTVTSVFD